MNNEQLILKELMDIKDDVGTIKGQLQWFSWKTVVPVMIIISAIPSVVL